MSTSLSQLYFYSPEGLVLVRHSGARASVLLRAAGQMLAQQDEGESAICAVDGQGSVLQFSSCLMQYTIYGYDKGAHCASVLRYTGQRKESATGHYLLGDGYRAQNPALMRFNSPDDSSPFEAGGINAYCYCNGDPVNNTDPSGHFKQLLMRFMSGKTNVTVKSYRSLNPGAKQADVKKDMSARLTEHNKIAYEKSFEYRLKSHGRDTGKWVDVFKQRKKFTKNDENLMTGVVVTVERDLQTMEAGLLQSPPLNQQDPRLFAFSEQLRLKYDVEIIKGYVVAPVDSWLHSKRAVQMRQPG